MNENNSLLNCNTTTPSIASTMNKFYLGLIIFNEFTSMYYDDKNDDFESLFKQYTASSANNIDHPALI